MGNDENNILYDYRNQIGFFYNYLREVYSVKTDFFNKPREHNGYIIKLEEFENLEVKIKSNDITNIIPIKTISINTSSKLISMINNGNKYIIINNKLRNTICEKEKQLHNPIIYYIDDKHLNIKLEKELKFLINYKNIISKEDLVSEENSNSNISNPKEVKQINPTTSNSSNPKEDKQINPNTSNSSNPKEVKQMNPNISNIQTENNSTNVPSNNINPEFMIIPLNESNKELSHLKQLLKIIYFQNEFLKNINFL